MQLPRSWTANARLRSMLTVMAALVAPGVIAAQGGTITGTVRVAGSGQPLASAHVTVLGSPLVTITDAAGKYTLRGAPSGRVEVRVTRIGFAEGKQPVTVTVGTPATLDFSPAEVSVRLQEVVTTATGVQRRIELGNTIATIGDVSTRVEQRSITNVSDLLVAKTGSLDVGGQEPAPRLADEEGTAQRNWTVRRRSESSGVRTATSSHGRTDRCS